MYIVFILYIYAMFRVCVATLRFSRLQSKVRSGVPLQRHSREDRFVLPLPTHLCLSSPPLKPPLRGKAPRCGGPESSFAPVVDSGKGGV